MPPETDEAQSSTPAVPPPEPKIDPIIVYYDKMQIIGVAVGCIIACIGSIIAGRYFLASQQWLAGYIALNVGVFIFGSVSCVLIYLYFQHPQKFAITAAGIYDRWGIGLIEWHEIQRISSEEVKGIKHLSILPKINQAILLNKSRLKKMTKVENNTLVPKKLLIPQTKLPISIEKILDKVKTYQPQFFGQSSGAAPAQE